MLRPSSTAAFSGLLFSQTPQGDLFVSIVPTVIGGLGIIARLLHLPFYRRPPLQLPCGLGSLLGFQVTQVAPSWILSANSSCGSGFRQDFPQNTTVKLLIPSPWGWGQCPALICASFVEGVPFPALGSLRVRSTQYRLALRYSFQCFLGFLFVSLGPWNSLLSVFSWLLV